MKKTPPVKIMLKEEQVWRGKGGERKNDKRGEQGGGRRGEVEQVSTGTNFPHKKKYIFLSLLKWI